MPLKSNEKKVLKAISSMLSHDLLGLDVHEGEETSHHSQFRWEEIASAFRLKCAKSPYCESMAAAFRKTHDYKYIDHPTFKLAMEADMRSMGLPRHVIEQALGYVDGIVNELKESMPSEKDAGWPDMDALHDVTTMAHDRKPKAEQPFTGGGPSPEGDKRKLKMESRRKRIRVSRILDEGLLEPRQAIKRLMGEIKGVSDPSQLKDLEKAVQRLNDMVPPQRGNEDFYGACDKARTLLQRKKKALVAQV